MSDPSPVGPDTTDRNFAELEGDKLHSALFAQMVLQQSNLALMLLGKVPHPETGETTPDLEAARLFIDQLEMLEVKTKGNLNPQEATLLKQTLMTLRLAFVEAVDATAKPGQSTPTPPDPAAVKQPGSSEDKPAPQEVTGAASEEETKKRFSKKY
jgi:hypothetical protein